MADEIVDVFNEVLLGEKEFPESWLRNGLPAQNTHDAKHLRPMVLSSCVAKVFTEALLQRIRPHLPSLRCGQLCARLGWQVMDGALAAQQLTRMAAEYSLPLLLLKLGIAAAFDSVEHPAVARFLCACQFSGPHSCC